MHSGINGTPMQTYRTPKAAARKARARRRQDKAWAAKAGAVEVAYACICESKPDNCRASTHSGKPLDAACSTKPGSPLSA